MSTGSLIPPEVLRQLQTMSNSRLELIIVEVEEVQDRAQRLICLALGLLVFAVLAVISLSAALVMALWSLGPVLVLLAIGVVWGITAAILYRCLFNSFRSWRPFAYTLDQLRQDRALIMEHLS